MGGVYFWFWAVTAVGLLQLPPAANAAPDPKVARAASAQVEQSLNVLLEQEKALAASVAELRAQIAELQRMLGEGREETKQKQEATHGLLDATQIQVKEMREEVRGLYVETSGLKGDVAQAAQQINSLDQNLSSFRLSAGIVVAVVIVLQLVLVGLTFRNRG